MCLPGPVNFISQTFVALCLHALVLRQLGSVETSQTVVGAVCFFFKLRFVIRTGNFHREQGCQNSLDVTELRFAPESWGAFATAPSVTKNLDEKKPPTSADLFFHKHPWKYSHDFPPWLCEPPVYWQFYLDSGLALKGPNKLRDCGGLYAIASWLGLLRSPKIEMCIFEKLWKLKRDGRLSSTWYFYNSWRVKGQSFEVKKVYMVFSK